MLAVCAFSQKVTLRHEIKDHLRSMVMAYSALSFMLGTVFPLATVLWVIFQ